MTIRINVDGQLGSERDRLLSPLDQGFLFGASVYETVRTYDGVPFLVERHLKRLRESALALGIDIVESDETLTRRVYETLEDSGNAESASSSPRASGPSTTAKAPPRNRPSLSWCARCRRSPRVSTKTGRRRRSCPSCVPAEAI